MAKVHASGSNTFVPNPEATGRLQIEYTRNPATFPLANYVTYIPVNLSVFQWIEIDREEMARVVNTNLADYVWYDGAAAPTGNGAGPTFEFIEGATIRYAYPERVGYMAAEQAAFDLEGLIGRVEFQRSMTARVVKVLTLMQTTTSWDSDHTIAVASISGVTGKWDVSTTARMDIKRSIDYAADKISLSTNGVIGEKDLVLVMSKSCARKISVSQEIVDYLKQSPTAIQFISGDGTNFGDFVLPKYLYGYRVIVEDTVRVSSLKGGTVVRAYVMDEDKPMLVARPGGLLGVEGLPAFSACSVFIYRNDDMTVETKDDPDNRRKLTRIVDQFVPKMTSNVGGFLFQDVIT